MRRVSSNMDREFLYRGARRGSPSDAARVKALNLPA